MTKQSEREVPAYLLERLFKGELPPAQAQALEAQLARSSGGASKVRDELYESDAAILAAHPPHIVAKEIERRAQRQARPQPRSFLMPAFALAAVGALLLLVLIPSSGSRAPSSPITAPENEEVIGLKGLKPHLVVYRKHDGAPQRLSAADRVRPGDVLQLAYVVPPDPSGADTHFGMIVSLDAKGTSTLHFPIVAGTAEPLKTQGETRLPAAYELDASPGFERFVLVISSRAFNTRDVTVALQEGRALPRGLVAFEITLLKEVP